METECGHWCLAFSSAYKRLFRAIPLFANEKKGVELLDYLGVFDPNGKNLDSRLRLFLGCIISSCQVNVHKNLQIHVTKNISGEMCVPRHSVDTHSAYVQVCEQPETVCICQQSFTVCVSDFREGWRGGSSHTLQSCYWIFLTNQHNKSKQQVLFELCPCAKKEKNICSTFTEELPHCQLCFWFHLGEHYFGYCN